MKFPPQYPYSPPHLTSTTLNLNHSRLPHHDEKLLLHLHDDLGLPGLHVTDGLPQHDWLLAVLDQALFYVGAVLDEGKYEFLPLPHLLIVHDLQHTAAVHLDPVGGELGHDLQH